MAALPALALPYGLRDIKLTPYAADGIALGTAVDLPAAQTLSFSEAEEFQELRGDDVLIAIRGQGAQVEWELEAGGISLAAYNVLAGGTQTDTGVTPNRIRKVAKTSTSARSYFKIEGQAISDSGGDFHVIIWKARANDTIEGEFTGGEFFVTSASGVGLPDNAGKLYDLIQNEAVTAIV